MSDHERRVFSFHAPEARRVDLSGGKGAGLARAAATLAVPRGVIITSHGYREFARPMQRGIASALERHAGDAEALSRTVQQLMAGQPLPEGLLCELEAALRAESLLGQGLAVRSSATQEDSAGAAFAGLHDTSLNRCGVDEVAEAMRACYMSLWNRHALEYRERLGACHMEAAMAVVVQRLVRVSADDAAGVAFSIDPVRGRLDTVLINAAFGLGESVVGGEEAVDEFRISRRAADDGLLPVIEQRVADKPRAWVPHARGTRRVQLGRPRRLRASLSAAACSEVADLALRAEKLFGFPQDIEWAYEGERLFLLQSRPLTRIPARWTRDESAERFPNVVTPMTWDLVEEAFHASLNHSFALMGLPPFHDKWFAVKDGYVYGNQNAVELYGGRLPDDLLGDLPALRAALPTLSRRYAWVVDLPQRWARDLDAYLLSIGALMAEPLDNLSIAELWDYVLRVRDLGRRYFLPNIAISLTQRALHGWLGRLVGLVTEAGDAEVRAMVERLLAVTDTVTGQINREMAELARVARSLPGGAQLVLRAARRPGWPELAEHPDFASRFRDFVQRHGHREVDFDAYHPTWIEAPHVVLTQIAGLAAQPEQADEQRLHELQVSMAAVEHDLLGAAPAELRYLLREVIRLARAYTALDDLEHYQTTRLTLPFRRGLAAIGRRLVEQGTLDRADDVYFCPVAIFGKAVADADFAPVAAAVAEHRRAYDAARMRTPEWELGVADVLDQDARVLQGLGASAGIAEARVFCVRGPEDFADFPSGAILVARTTNPAWTPLFYRSAGVIAESGGPLSHGAVTARELGLPAVMSVRRALDLLRTGTRVRMDGAQGRVQRIDD